MAPPIRVALLGYGLAGAVFHAPLIDAVEGLELTAIVTRDDERRSRALRQHPNALLLDSAEDVWERAGELELVVVASPNRFHIPLAGAAVAAGIAVVVDKPLAAHADEARALVREARERGVLLTVFQNRRWDGDFLTVRRLLETGQLGTAARFESRFERWRPELSGGWRESADSEDAGGLLYDLGSHLVDQSLQLFGPAAEVYAELDARRAGARTDDDTFVALTHESGVRSHLWMSAIVAGQAPRFRVLGSAATFTKYGLDVQEDALRDGVDPRDPDWGREPAEHWGELATGDEIRPIETVPGAYQRFYEGVVSALREGAPPPVDPDQVVTALGVLEAARLAARERLVVRPSLPGSAAG
ncbi:MAG TPA: Gfo/Idh/MocA family oxidoreductase [Gaiellaceae bacterium]|nr:Gfo/Idh/MocA family oxidoreductase [Gaiellaceae bacterium]